jgi:ATP-binding cassette, subfamily C, bacterial
VSFLARPYLSLVWHTPALRRGALTCVMLAIVAAAAEIAVAMSLIPILASLGVDAGEHLASLIDRVPPVTWLVLFAAAAALRALANWLVAAQIEHASQALVVSMQSRLYRALARAHWDTIRRLEPPAIASALHTQSYDAGYAFSYVVQVAAASVLVIGYATSAAVVFPILLPVLVVLIALVWRLNAGRGNRVRVMAEDYAEAQTELHQRYEDWVAISRIVPLGVDSKKLADRFESDARDAAAHAVGFGRSAAATRISYEMAVVGGVLAGVPIAWWMETPPALLVFALVLLVRVLPRAGGIHEGYHHIVGATAPVRAVDSLAARLEKDAVVLPASPTPLAWTQLELIDLGVEGTLRKDGRRWILRGANFELRHGEWLALTGPTGAGKTTLAEAMLALVRPDAGELRIDGAIVDDELAGQWRAQAAYVPQDVVLFDASIRDNLRLYVPDADDAQLEAALAQAAGEFVTERLPDGLDTRVGPGGRWLSGGERQRIGIARALLRRPGFIVLDEPTAALDTDTQTKLMDALAGLQHTMSVVIITHRPELLQLVDRVVEVADGVISRQYDAARYTVQGSPPP